MNDGKIARLRRGAVALRRQFAQPAGGVFSRALSEWEIAEIVAAYVKDYRDRIYPPLDTLRRFVGQVLASDSVSGRGGKAIIRAHSTGKISQHAQHGISF